MSNTRILLVEDDPNFGSVLSDYLRLNDYVVVHAGDGNVGLAKFRSESFDLCIFDVMMPVKDGFSLAREIQELNENKTPFIFLTAKNMKEDMVRGFKLGADDYLTKPFDSEVLLLKIQAILSRRNSAPVERQTEYDLGGFTFNAELRHLVRGGESARLSPKEARLLEMLAQRKNEVLSRSEALKTIWHDDNYFTSRSMDVYIAKLRKYLKSDPKLEIINVHGEGFRLVEAG
jgi:two-component system OmpR family response regulator